MRFETIDDLKNSRDIIKNFLSEYRKLGKIWTPIDIFVISILNRMSAIDDAFNELTFDPEDSGVAAFPLIRLQLDNLLYCYAGTRVEDLMHLMECFMSEKNWSSLKDKENGTELKENYLVDCLCKKLDAPVLKKIYKKASDYIHLSTDHLAISLSKKGDEPIKTKVEGYDTTSHRNAILNMMVVLNQALFKIIAEDWALYRIEEHKMLQKLKAEHPELSDLEVIHKYGCTSEKFADLFYKRLRRKE